MDRDRERWAHGELGDGRTGPQDADYPAWDEDFHGGYGRGDDVAPTSMVEQRPRYQPSPTRGYTARGRSSDGPRGSQHGYRLT